LIGQFILIYDCNKELGLFLAIFIGSKLDDVTVLEFVIVELVVGVVLVYVDVVVVIVYDDDVEVEVDDVGDIDVLYIVDVDGDGDGDVDSDVVRSGSVIARPDICKF
jgi:hypothetical protein